MGTLGLVTIIRNGRVWAKVACTCEGFAAEKLAEALIDDQVFLTAAGVYQVAQRVGMGCQDCLVVVTADGCVGSDDPPEYFFGTLQDPLRHPADTRVEATHWPHTFTVFLEV